jgi:hypothetical protein
MTTEKLKGKSIPFSQAMVQAILDGKKTMTRRIVKPTQSTPRVAPITMEPWIVDGEQQEDERGWPCWVGTHPDYPSGKKWFSCPYGKVGDYLWVKEAFRLLEEHDKRTPNEVWEHSGGTGASKQFAPFVEVAGMPFGRYRHARFMPRWASRIDLQITGVRVEQLQSITGADARAEGMAPAADLSENYVKCHWDAVEEFRSLWDTINGAGSWDLNPFVWVVEFKRIE